jgi:hypothetical protein
LGENVVPLEYSNVQKTPLEIDTTSTLSFNLKIRKPASGASKSATPASPFQTHGR